MPLGILSAAEFETKIQKPELAIGGRAFAYSDGIFDCLNPAGEMYGEPWLEAQLDGATRSCLKGF